MARLNDVPNGVSDAGLEFNYAVWGPGTTATLCNVPWNSDYRDIVKFASQQALDDYLTQNSGAVWSFPAMTYARAGMPVRVNLPFNACYKYNYLRVTNGMQPVGHDSSRSFYYFVTDVRYVAPNTTELVVQLDVWQTFNRDVTFGNCYVERGHIGIANENQMQDNGREYLTIPEGLDVGGEYIITRNLKQTIGSRDASGGASFDIIVATTVSFEGSGGTVDNPVLESAKGSSFESLPNGVELYYFPSATAFINFMRQTSDLPWVSQGIISVTAVPEIPSSQLQVENVTTSWGVIVQRLLTFRVPPFKRSLAGNWRNMTDIPSRYAHLSKFLTYPYSMVELTTYSGTPLVLKPENMAGDDLDVVQLVHYAPPSPRVAFYPYRYNASEGNADVMDGAYIHNDQGEFLDMTTGMFNLPTFSVVNNSYLAYMAANANSVAYQHASADWSQQKTLTGNSLSYNQATSNMGLATRLNEMQMRAGSASNAIQNQQAVANAAIGGVTSLAGGAMGGPAGLASSALGVASSAASTAVDINARNQQLAVSQGLARSQTSAQVGNQGYMRDTNKEFADYAAQGDYENTIAAINAKVQDARLIQPTTAGQIGGDAFNLVAYEWAIHAKVKRIQGAALAAIGEYWLRYGYAINRFVTPPMSLQVMEKFTYWKLRETYLKSTTCPESFRQTIRGIFEKGVTVWNDPADIGTVDIADNAPLSGVTL